MLLGLFLVCLLGTWKTCTSLQSPCAGAWAASPVACASQEPAAKQHGPAVARVKSSCLRQTSWQMRFLCMPAVSMQQKQSRHFVGLSKSAFATHGCCANAGLLCLQTWTGSSTRSWLRLEDLTVDGEYCQAPCEAMCGHQHHQRRSPSLPAGFNKINDKQLAEAEKQMKKYEVMISSMTPQERSTPELLATGPSRRRRIARGSGRKELDVTNMVAQFSAMRSRMRDMSKMMAMSGGRGGLRLPAAPGELGATPSGSDRAPCRLYWQPVLVLCWSAAHTTHSGGRVCPTAHHCMCQVCLPW